jgi:multiple sugar transport system permease protein
VNFRLREAAEGYLFLLPNIVGVLTFVAFPVVAAIYLSFTDWNLLRGGSFVGLENYQTLLFDDPLFRKVVSNTVLYVVGTVPASLAIALALAIALNQKIRGMVFFRSLYFLPVVSSTVAVALVWRWLYNPSFGPVNAFLGVFGIPGPPWLGSTAWALPAVAIMTIWKNVGYYMVLFLAGLQGIPEHLYEAAEIEGANGWAKFRHITLPLLSPTTFFVLVIAGIGAFQVFTQALVMAEGGPADSTNTIVLYIYQAGFKFYKMGYAAAMAWILFFIIFAVTLVQNRLQRRWVYYEGQSPGAGQGTT